ncbi:MAG: MFS transporter [Proteobacteria bacterium]|nr:MFS transporter [Pseudomonadota bacterium]MBU1584715.1 MFS transporter [Pseudomonadota bacterium]MBU2631234.1 MFS transporter [Pseudomonadota bacterium]
MHKLNGKDNFSSQLFPLFFLTSIFFLNFTIRIIISPLLPTILTDMNLTRDQAGSFFLVSASGYFISLLCSGFVSSKLFHKKTIVFSAVATGLAFIGTGMSQTLLGMRLGLFIVGMTAALYLPSGIAMLTSSITSRNWGKAIGIHELAPNLSFLLAPIICEGLLLWLSWRSVLMVIGTTSVLFGFSFFRFSTVTDFPGESPRLKSFLPLVATPSFWLMVALFSLGVTGTLGVYSMLPLYLVKEHGLLQSEANTLITMSRILTLPMPFVVGWLSDRFGLKLTLSFDLFFTGISTLFIGLLSGRFIQIVIFCQPVLAVCFFPPAFAALSHIGSKETRNIAVSFTIPIAFLLGGGLIPNLIGILGEKGFFNLGFIAAGALILLGAVLPAFLKFCEDS